MPIRRAKKIAQTPPSPGPAPIEDPRPPRSVLYSRYIAARPHRPSAHGVSLAALGSVRAHMGMREDVRSKVLLALQDGAPSITRGRYDPNAAPTMEGLEALATVTAARLSRDWGELSLATEGSHALDGLIRAVMEERDPRVLDVAGAWLDAFARVPGTPWMRQAEDRFCDLLDGVLAETTYARRGRDIVLREDAGSAPVVEQPLRAFMTDNPRFAAVDAKLAEAFAQLDLGHGADAITDAGTALQMLFNELGHSAPTLGEQIKVARKAGLFTTVDHRLGDALNSLSLWIASVRNQRGDAHPGPVPDLMDAKFLVRMTAVLVMRLAE